MHYAFTLQPAGEDGVGATPIPGRLLQIAREGCCMCRPEVHLRRPQTDPFLRWAEMQDVQRHLPILGMKSNHQSSAEPLNYQVGWIVCNGGHLQHWIAPRVQEHYLLHPSPQF